MSLGKPGSPYSSDIKIYSLFLVLGFPMAKVEYPHNFLDVPQALPSAKVSIVPGNLLPSLSPLLVCERPPKCSCAQESNLAATLDFCRSFTTHIKNSQLINFTSQFSLEPVQFSPKQAPIISLLDYAIHPSFSCCYTLPSVSLVSTL